MASSSAVDRAGPGAGRTTSGICSRVLSVPTGRLGVRTPTTRSPCACSTPSGDCASSASPSPATPRSAMPRGWRPTGRPSPRRSGSCSCATPTPPPPPAPAAGTGSRDWQHRSMVRMHKVRQWYPSEQCHKVLYCGLYIKGPADKPLLGGETVRPRPLTRGGCAARAAGTCSKGLALDQTPGGTAPGPMYSMR